MANINVKKGVRGFVSKPPALKKPNIVSLRVGDDLKRKIDKYCEAKNISVVDFIRAAINDKLTKGS